MEELYIVRLKCLMKSFCFLPLGRQIRYKTVRPDTVKISVFCIKKFSNFFLILKNFLLPICRGYVRRKKIKLLKILPVLPDLRRSCSLLHIFYNLFLLHGVATPLTNLLVQRCVDKAGAF